LPKPFTLSKRFAVLMLILAGLSGVAYGLHAPPRAARDQTLAIDSDATDSSPRAAPARSEPVRRVMDDAGFLDDYTTKGLDGYLSGINVESGVDVRFIFAREVSGNLESFALKRARELGMGRDMNRRSLLFVYDVAGQRMRVEVGPGMEGMFPDGFLGYLMREQTAAFFASGDRHLAIKSTLNIVSHRLREAALGGTYNPRAVAYITDSRRLAVGGGASARAPLGKNTRPFGERIATLDALSHFGPQPTVADAFARYLEALRDGHYEPDLHLYTPETQLVWRRFPIKRPFAEFIVYAEYGHKYEIVERGDLAILFFTTTPLVSSHLFRRFPDGWRLDIAAEIEDTREFVGGPYTWGMMSTGDDYSRAFSDVMADYGPTRFTPRPGGRAMPTRILRPARGDNRPLPTRKGHAAPPVRMRTPRPAGYSALLLPQAGTRTEDFGYPTQTIDRLAVRRLLMARSYDTLDTVLSAYADSVLRDYRLEYRLFDAYAAFDVAMPALEPLLNEWVERHPASAAALLARGTFFSASGWHARGYKFARETNRNQFQQMNAFFRRSTADFHAALRLAPNSIVAYRALISMTSTTESDSATSRQLLDRALKIQPYSFRLRATHMENLLPRWGGSYESMTKFAVESARYAPRNPRLRALGGFVDWDQGRVLERDGQKAEAIKAYERALRFGNFWRFQFERGELYFYDDKDSKAKEALQDLDSALVQVPQDADALYERSYVSYVLGLDAAGDAKGAYFAQAFDDIVMSVALDPMDEDHQKHLAFIRENIPEYAPPLQP
jgi:uncharacterized protein